MSVYLNFKFPNSSAEALDRVVEAYGFSMKMELAEHLGIAASSLSARYKREVFPSDIVLQCAMETGASLEWLVTGKGRKFEDSKLDILTISRKKLIDGKIFDSGFMMLDKVIFPTHKPISNNLICVVDDTAQYIIDKDFTEVIDSDWLVEIEEKVSVRTLTRIPIRKVRVSGVGMAFDCSLDDIKIAGKVILTLTSN